MDRRWLLGAALGLLACGPKHGSQVRLATFNAHNLAESDSPAKRRGVARILEAVDADVVLLQEIGGPRVLDALAAEPPVAGRYPYQVALPDNDPRGFGLGLLARLRPRTTKSHRDDRFALAEDPTGREYRYTRDCLEVHFDVPEGHLALLGVHFRAQLADDPDHRLAEAEHTRRIADELMRSDPELSLAVLGDFNDVPGSAPLDALVAPAPPLTSVTSTQPAPDRWTLEAPPGQGGGRLFDDLLVDQALMARLQSESVSVLHDPDLPEDLAEVSDHAPVAATFDIRR
jgi:endonuclease/exonuclease/phosphatase family metal-dependent hydrolase